MTKKSQFTEEQIRALLKEGESGEKVQDICARHGISTATYYKWRAQHQDETTLVAQRLKKLEEENRRLKALVADLTLRNEALKDVVTKKW